MPTQKSKNSTRKKPPRKVKLTLPPDPGTQKDPAPPPPSPPRPKRKSPRIKDATKPKLSTYLHDAVQSFIKGNSYTPGTRLPARISAEILASCSSVSDGTTHLLPPGSPNSLPISYETHAQNGAMALKLALFVMLLGDIRKNSADYVKTVVNNVCSANLTRIMEKINPKLVEGVVRDRDDALYAYIGMLWFQEGYGVERVANLLSPIFRPILDVAGKELKKYQSEYPTLPETGRPHSRTITSANGAIFIRNLEVVQNTRPAHIPASPPPIMANIEPFYRKQAIERPDPVIQADLSYEECLDNDDSSEELENSMALRPSPALCNSQPVFAQPQDVATSSSGAPGTSCDNQIRFPMSSEFRFAMARSADPQAYLPQMDTTSWPSPKQFQCEWEDYVDSGLDKPPPPAPLSPSNKQNSPRQARSSTSTFPEGSCSSTKSDGLYF